MTNVTMRRALPAAAGLVLVAAVLLTGCSGAGSAGSGASAGRGAPAGGGAMAAPARVPGAGAHPAGGGPAAAVGGAGQPASSAGAARLAPAGQNIVYAAAMSVRVRNVSRAAARAAAIAEGAGGYVSQETLSQETASQETVSQKNGGSPGAPRGGAASIQLKVPVAAYQATLGALAGLGAQLSLQQQAQDVTQQVADTASRVVSDKAVISQLRGLLSRAGSVSNLLTVQDQISSQESALEAMQAQQRALNNETAYATVSLQLQGPVVARHISRHLAKAHHGFVAGLTAGWKALVTLISWLLSALGAVLPVGAALALAGYLGYRGLRGRRWLQRRGARP